MDLQEVMKNLTVTPTKSINQQLFKLVTADIDDVSTRIVYAEFNNKTLIILTQYDKVGTLLTVHRDQVGANDVYTTNICFGASGDDQQVAVRFLAEHLKITTPLCIFINLKSYSIRTLKACLTLILDLQEQAQKEKN